MATPDYESRKSLARANREFYGAFEALDLERMRALWLNSSEVKCVHPGGEILVGFERVQASWEAIFRSSSGPRIALEDVDLALAGSVGWVSLVERFRNADEPGPGSALAATNLFRHADGEWRLVLHHASPLARRFFP